MRGAGVDRMQGSALFRRWRWASATLVMAVCAAQACRLAPGRAPLVVTLDRVPTTLDPHQHNELVGWSLLCNFYDSLVSFSPEMRVEPALAESWAVLDPNHVRFTLRRGVRFSNGEAFGSSDVVASFQRAIRDPSSKIRHYLVGIRSVAADGANAVVIETVRPSPTLLNRLAFLFIVPHAQAATPEITRPVGTGPYRFVGRRGDGSVVAEAWSGWRGTADARRVLFNFVEDEDQRSDRFVAGGVDVCYRLVDGIVPEIGRRQGLRVKQQPALTVQILEIVPHAATGEARRALAVPDSAVVEDDLTGETRVARVERGVAVWTPVTLGLAEGGWHELRAPALAAGTVVVVSGQHGLPDSTHV
ncbi:MAG TPA: ABC transporter substrate-binding protein, partial [Thermoanaerobaculaceae bacterium]|nr:ABC transporter substrate-binding protein [Thermoanaerobaculaceae bacterium]